MNIPGFLVVGIPLVLGITFWVLRRRTTALRETQLSLKRSQEEAKQKERALSDARTALEGATVHLEQAKRLLSQKSAAIPWLAELVADLHFVQDERDVRHLRRKSRPAWKAAETLRLHIQEKKELRRQKRLVDYRLAMIESLFPWTKEIGFEDAEELAESEILDDNSTNDPASSFLSRDEWMKLPELERFQRALDRYKQRKKSLWQIGREYERYVGYRWELNGCEVTYNGAIKGFEDYGRDLIVHEPEGMVALVQCKFWSQHKVIPEAAIFQLLGTTVSYYIETMGEAPSNLQRLFSVVQPYLYSSTVVAPRFKEIAKAMGIVVQEKFPIEEWPMIKCNISSSGERIFHLPMDQQYDRVKLTKPGECYAWTVAEASTKGFRRAKRWMGSGEVIA